MGFTDDLIAATGQLLDTEDAGTWKASGIYLVSDVRPIFSTVMPASPDVAICLSAYDVANDPTSADSIQGLQVRTRGTKDPRTVNDLDDDVFDVLASLLELTFASGKVLHAYRRSSAPLGQDSSGRHERSSNYYLTVHRPSQHRL